MWPGLRTRQRIYYPESLSYFVFFCCRWPVGSVPDCFARMLTGHGPGYPVMATAGEPILRAVDNEAHEHPVDDGSVRNVSCDLAESSSALRAETEESFFADGDQ